MVTQPAAQVSSRAIYAAQLLVEHVVEVVAVGDREEERHVAWEMFKERIVPASTSNHLV